MVADAVTIAVSGLSCYCSAVAATAALSSAVIAVDVTTTVADAKNQIENEECADTPHFLYLNN